MKLKFKKKQRKPRKPKAVFFFGEIRKFIKLQIELKRNKTQMANIRNETRDITTNPAGIRIKNTKKKLCKLIQELR